jgi:hypothetical protein
MDIHIYEDLTGAFTGVAFGTKLLDPASMTGFLNLHLLRGHSPYAGTVVDSLSQRVDIGSGKLVICQPVHSAAAQIAALESRQLRPLRELALGLPGALQRLADLNRQIEALR